MATERVAKFPIGAVVKHRLFPFRGVVFDIDPLFANTEEWYQAIPAEVRPRKDQPYYHLFAENAETEYVAYVSEQNLLPDESGEPLRHPEIDTVFTRAASGVLLGPRLVGALDQLLLQLLLAVGDHLRVDRRSVIGLAEAGELERQLHS